MAGVVPAELQALPLEQIIGSPLGAAIKAQAIAARTTVDFIRDVGLNRSPATGEYSAVTVDFKFDRTIEETLPPLVSGGPTGKGFRIIPSKLEVPLLAIVPIPFIRITDMTIDFEYKIRDVEQTEHVEELGIQAKVEAQYWFIKAEVSGSYTNKSTNKRETDRSASLRITVNAAQDQIPEGLARVLEMMHEQLKVVPLSSGTVLPTPAARINSFSPIRVSADGTPKTFLIAGERLIGAKVPTFDDSTGITSVNIVQRAAAPTTPTDAYLEVEATFGTTAVKGERTINIDTPQGVATAKFSVA
jgi:Protein of unknown function (DUF2589)